MDSIVVVESENGDRHDFTTLQVSSLFFAKWNINAVPLILYKPFICHEKPFFSDKRANYSLQVSKYASSGFVLIY